MGEAMTTNQTIDGVPRDRVKFLVELLGAVACAAFWAADNGEDDGSEGISVQRSDFDELSKALDACDELPELPGNVVRDGWLRAVDELRALLDAPARTPLLGGGALEEQPEWAQIQILKNTVADLQGDIEKLQADIAAQPQGEPFGYWLFPKGLPLHGRFHRVTGSDKVIDSELVVEAFDITPLYAEQPAPVAVVMPERKDAPDCYFSPGCYDSGWNACLDEVARLNAKS